MALMLDVYQYRDVRRAHQLLEVAVADVGDVLQLDGDVLLVVLALVLLYLDLDVVAPDLMHLWKSRRVNCVIHGEGLYGR